MEITYDQGSELIRNKSRKYLIEEEYGIVAKPSNLVNTTSNARLECITQVLGNLVHTYNIKETYIDKDHP